jgi:four helix bundle protein
LKAYRITAAFPKDERYGLASQIKRSAVSIPSNIAEGYGRKTTVDYVRFFYIAYGSTCELETQILLAGDLGIIDTGNLGETLGSVKEVERMLKALIRTLEQKHSDP